MDRSEFEEKIRDYTIDEGILGKKLPSDPKLEFGYEINYPPNSPKQMKIIALKQKDRKAVAIQIATQIAPVHVDALKKKGPHELIRFFIIFKKYMLMQNLLYNIDPKNARYIISDTIYPDGLNEHNFHLILRKVFNTSMYMNMILMDLIAGNIDPSKKDFGDLELPGGGNMMFT
jgi:hypothetical protein